MEGEGGKGKGEEWEKKQQVQRILLSLAKIWTMAPHITLGEILEIISGKVGRYMVVANRKDGQVESIDSEYAGPNLISITHDEWEIFMTKINEQGFSEPQI